MTADDVNKYAEDLRAVIEDRLLVKGRSLEHALMRAGRLLPKWAGVG